MKKIIFFILAITFITPVLVFSQVPEIEYQLSFGGNFHDFLTEGCQTNDGGYLYAGSSSSDISGDKSENSEGIDDYWIIKTDAANTIVWQNTIGGSSADILVAAKETADNGFILAGYSFSAMSGDKSENNTGLVDFWLVKLNASGGIEWQNTIGGNGNDYTADIAETSDGGFIVGGRSDSGISGDKNDPSKGDYDYWILKLSSSGEIIWQRTIGGSAADILSSIEQTSDGGYVAAGHSASSISGDKTEGNIGAFDYWILRLDESGNILWQNTIGGKKNDYVNNVTQTADGGFIIAGQSNSGATGDKTELHEGSTLKSDYWIVKLNSAGNIEWQNNIGGDENESLRDIVQTADGGYLLAGYSESGISGEKTEPNYGPAETFDFWLIKLNSTGALVWQKAFGGSANDILLSAAPVSDGGLLLAGYSDSEISGNKNAPKIGLSDYWIIKFLPEECPVPESLFTDNIHANKATAHWDGITGVSSFQVWYTVTGSGVWTKKNTALPYKTINGLIPATSYEYKVRSKCSDGSFSSFSSLQSFSTPALREGLAHDRELVLFPNPAKEVVYLQTQGISFTGIEIYDAAGNKMMDAEYTKNDYTCSIKIDMLPKGIFILKGYSDSEVFSLQFIHQ